MSSPCPADCQPGIGSPTAPDTVVSRQRRVADVSIIIVSFNARVDLERDPDVAVVGPRLVDATGSAELSFGAMIGPFNELRQKWRTRTAIERLTRQQHYPDWVSGACLLVRRIDAEATGLLDERFFMYTE